MTPAELGTQARESADLARVCRVYAACLLLTDRTGLEPAAARVAESLADRYSLCSLQLAQAAGRTAREVA